jgi:hypothetical protein
MKMKKFKTRTLIASAVLGLAAAGSAQADLFATSYISLQNLQFQDSDGNILDADTDFNSIAFTSSADYDGVLSGQGSFGDNEPNGGNIDFLAGCLGDCPVLTENQQPPTLLTGPQGTDFVTADQYQWGAPITNLDNTIDGTGDFTTGADVLNITTANLSATAAEGSANVNNALEGNWTFSLTGAGVISITADDVSTYLEAFASAGEIFPGKASASTSWSITITDIGGEDGFGIIFDTNDIALFDVFNPPTTANANDLVFNVQTCGALAGLGAPCGVGVSTPFSIDTPFLSANNLYQISLRQNTNIDIARVNHVPEPGILALLGMGLMGMFLTRRKG